MRNVNTISFNFIVYLFVLFAAFFFFYISWIWRKCVLSVYLVISSMFCSNNNFKNYINYILNRSKMKELSVQVPCRQRWDKHSITEIIQWTTILKKLFFKWHGYNLSCTFSNFVFITMTCDLLIYDITRPLAVKFCFGFLRQDF